MRISDVPGHLRSWKPCQKIPPQSIWCFTVSVTISEWFHTVLLAGVEVIQEHVVKKPILTLAISKLTDYYKVETSHWVPRLIRYRPTLFLFAIDRVSVNKCGLQYVITIRAGGLMMRQFVGNPISTEETSTFPSLLFRLLRKLKSEITNMNEDCQLIVPSALAYSPQSVEN